MQRYSCYFLEASSYVGQKQSESVIFSSKINKSKFEGHRIVLLDELFDNGMLHATFLMET